MSTSVALTYQSVDSFAPGLPHLALSVNAIAENDRGAETTISDDDSSSVFDWNDHGSQQNEPSSHSGETLNDINYFSACALSPLRYADDIRVLEFEDSCTHGELRCRVRTVSLGDSPEYLTLSYACGPAYADGSHLVRRIICNNFQFAVTSTLHAALERVHLLLKNGGRSNNARSIALWVDAICINQFNAKERSVQVSLMAQIFQSSQQTLVWLGEDPLASPDLLALTNRDHNASAPACNMAGKRMCRALVQEVVRYPWFRRRWIIQEFLLSKAVAFLLGHQIFPEFDFRDQIALFGPLPTLLTGKFSPLNSPTLLENLDLYATAQCSDPRDIIYSLLSISRDKADFRVDYTQDIVSVCTGVAKIYAQKGLLLNILARAMKNPSPQSLSDWPTWLPDWRSPPLEQTQKLGLDDDMNTFRVSEYPNYRISSNQLVVHGWILPRTSRRYPNAWLQTLEPLYGRPPHITLQRFIFVCSSAYASLEPRLILLLESDTILKDRGLRLDIDLVWSGPFRFLSLSTLRLPCPTIGKTRKNVYQSDLGSQSECSCQNQHGCQFKALPKVPVRWVTVR